MVCSKPSKRYWIRHSLGYSAQINGTDNQRKEAQQQKGTTTHPLENSICCIPHFLNKTDNLTALVEFPMHCAQISDFQLFPPFIFIIIIVVITILITEVLDKHLRVKITHNLDVSMMTSSFSNS